MTSEDVQTMKQVAYILSQVAAAQFRLAGMEAFNRLRAQRGQTEGYDEEAFENAVNEYGLSHNAVTSILNRPF